MKKLLKARKKNNKGFSLVELIVVIAIMAVLVGILAPQFIKYVDKSKKSTDIKNGQEIATAINASIAAGDTGYTGTVALTNVASLTNMPSSMGTWPTVKSKDATANFWFVSFNPTSGDVKVYITTAASAATDATNMVYPTPGTDFTK